MCAKQVHPTVNPGSGDILELIRDKKVLAKPGIERVDGLTVHFTDGSREEVDAIICATGELSIGVGTQELSVAYGVMLHMLQS